MHSTRVRMNDVPSPDGPYRYDKVVTPVPSSQVNWSALEPNVHSADPHGAADSVRGDSGGRGEIGGQPHRQALSPPRDVESSLGVALLTERDRERAASTVAIEPITRMLTKSSIRVMPGIAPGRATRTSLVTTPHYLQASAHIVLRARDRRP